LEKWGRGKAQLSQSDPWRGEGCPKPKKAEGQRRAADPVSGEKNHEAQAHPALTQREQDEGFDF